jgi:hypothetical protein
VQVHGDADRAGLVGDGTGDRLADPPGRIRGELEALAPVELLDGADEAKVAFLDQVEEVDAGGVGIAPGIGDDEAEIGRQEIVLGLLTVTSGALQFDPLDLALVVLFIETGLGFLASFDPSSAVRARQ